MDSINKLTIAETLEVVYLLDYPVNIKFYPFEVDCSEIDAMTIKLPNNLGIWKIEKAEGRQLKTVQLTGLFTTLDLNNPIDFHDIATALYNLDSNLRKIRSNQGLIQLFLESDIHN